MDSSVNIKKRKNCGKRETPSIETSSHSNESLQHLSNLQKKESGESSQDSRDSKRVKTEPIAGTSSATEIIVQPVYTKADCSEADCSRASILKNHCFDPEISNSRDQITLKTIDEALKQKFDLMFESLSSSLTKIVRFDEDLRLCLPITDFFENIEGANLETIEIIRAFLGAPVRSASEDEEYIDGLDENYCEYGINQVVAILIKRLYFILRDMDKLLKVMEKGPFWKPLIKKGYDACCFDAGRSLRYKINDRIIKSTFNKWPDVKFNLYRLFQWLDVATFWGVNLTEHRDRMIFMHCVREMILIVLISGGLLEISGNFGELLVTYPSNNIECVMDVKSQLDSINMKLILLVGYIQRLQEITEK